MVVYQTLPRFSAFNTSASAAAFKVDTGSPVTSSAILSRTSHSGSMASPYAATLYTALPVGLEVSSRVILDLREDAMRELPRLEAAHCQWL